MDLVDLKKKNYTGMDLVDLCSSEINSGLGRIRNFENVSWNDFFEKFCRNFVSLLYAYYISHNDAAAAPRVVT
jgi:hypothetical protein